MLYGAVREAPCEVLAWKSLAGDARAYSQLRVITSSLDLPDGPYLVVVEQRRYPTEKGHGRWLMTPAEQEEA
jgi:hypothetical protein